MVGLVVVGPEVVGPEVAGPEVAVGLVVVVDSGMEEVVVGPARSDSGK